jgi:hypothetical protein
MRLNTHFRLLLMSVASLAVASPAFASFHLMQIQQVIGGVGSDTSLQAVQLRMRVAGQNLVGGGRLRAWDATGSNPIVIIDPTTNVPNGAAGDTVLIASPNFQGAFGLTPDFVMTNLIPASYLAAGKLTWEDNSGALVYWSLAWGDGAYTGTNTGTIDNDADGVFNPPFGLAMPSATGQALQFTGPPGAVSTNNAADYAITVGNATFTNNAGQSGTVPVELMHFKVE